MGGVRCLGLFPKKNRFFQLTPSLRLRCGIAQKPPPRSTMVKQGCLVQVNNAQHLIYSVTPDSGPSQLSVILSVQSTQSSNARLWNMRCDRLDLRTASLLERQGVPVRVHKSRSRPCWLPSTLHRSLWNGEDDRKKRVLHTINILFFITFTFIISMYNYQSDHLVLSSCF